ncbi:MAG: transporter substrate-binding domain-containing protein, partial [Oscillospiraceae bacterium]
PWEQVEEMLKNGELDALFQVQKNPQRERQYFFSQLLRNAVTEIVSGSSHLKLESLGEIEKNPYTLGVLGGYAYSKEIDGINPKNKKFYATSWELIKALSKNEVDFAVCDRGVLEYIQRQESLENIYPLSNLEFIRPLFVMFRDFDLCARFSAAQRALK